MLLVLAAVKMKDSETDRHKRAFWDLLQLQEAASPSKFATWQWWSACLIRWCVSPQVCTPRRTRKHNWECVQRLEGCLTTSLVCLCLCVLRLLSSLSCLFHPLPRSLSVCLSWRESWGNRWKSIRREQTSYIPSVMFRKQFNVLGWRYALLLDDNGESVDNSPCRHEVNRSLGPGCTVLELTVSVHPTTVMLRLHQQSTSLSFRPLIAILHVMGPIWAPTITGCTHDNSHVNRTHPNLFWMQLLSCATLSNQNSCPSGTNPNFLEIRKWWQLKSAKKWIHLQCVHLFHAFDTTESFFYCVSVKKRVERHNKGCRKRRRGVEKKDKEVKSCSSLLGLVPPSLHMRGGPLMRCWLPVGTSGFSKHSKSGLSSD